MNEARPGDEFFDDDAVFTKYQAQRHRPDSPNEVLELPIIEALLGDVNGKDVLDLGCGEGIFGRQLLERGIASYVGVDASARMIELAKRHLAKSRATLHLASIESWDYPRSAFDLVVSRLCLHYVDPLTPVLRNIRKSLRKTGRFVCSVEHPVLTSNDESGGGRRGSWLVDRYFERGPRVSDWMGGRVIKYHRTIEDYVKALATAGFTVEELRESDPDPARFADRDELTRRRRIPLMLLFAASPNA